MEILKFAVQFLIIIIFIYFVSGRLIGPKVNMMKRILSVGISVMLTTFVFWYTYSSDKSIDEMISLDSMKVLYFYGEVPASTHTTKATK